jgi:hypothetical protein
MNAIDRLYESTSAFTYLMNVVGQMRGDQDEDGNTRLLVSTLTTLVRGAYDELPDSLRTEDELFSKFYPHLFHDDDGNTKYGELEGAGNKVYNFAFSLWQKREDARVLFES